MYMMHTLRINLEGFLSPGHNILSLETSSHPLPLLTKKKDGAMGTVIKGSWVFTEEKGQGHSEGQGQTEDHQVMKRVPFLELIRLVYGTSSSIYFPNCTRKE